MEDRIMTRTVVPSRKQGEMATWGRMMPFRGFPYSLGRMRDEFDQWFAHITREFSALAETNGEGWRWGLEVEDEDDRIVVRAEAPGFEPGEFDVRVEGGRLILRAARKIETKDDKGEIKETREQECYEAIVLPEGIDKDRVEAKYINGVLTVTVPRTAAGKAKRIAVKAG
jgi:HSP20 family protein